MLRAFSDARDDQTFYSSFKWIFSNSSITVNNSLLIPTVNFYTLALCDFVNVMLSVTLKGSGDLMLCSLCSLPCFRFIFT